jgi:hypothetical protein
MQTNLFTEIKRPEKSVYWNHFYRGKFNKPKEVKGTTVIMIKTGEQPVNKILNLKN